jgi:hypothetical protein
MTICNINANPTMPLCTGGVFDHLASPSTTIVDFTVSSSQETTIVSNVVPDIDSSLAQSGQKC